MKIQGVDGKIFANDVAVIKKLHIGKMVIDELAVSFGNEQMFDVLDLKEKPALFIGMDGMELFDRVSIDFLNKRVGFALADASREQLPLSKIE